MIRLGPHLLQQHQMIPGGFQVLLLCSFFKVLYKALFSNAYHPQGRIQDLVKGAPEVFWPIFANSTQQSCVNEVSPYWLGSRAHPRALEALGFFITKYAFCPFGVPFYTIFEIIKY